MNVHWNYRLLWNWPCAWHHPVSSDPDADHLDSKMVKSLTRKLFYQRLHFSISRRARDKSSIWNKFWGLWHTKEFKLYFKNNKMSVDQLVIGRFIQKFINTKVIIELENIVKFPIGENKRSISMFAIHPLSFFCQCRHVTKFATVRHALIITGQPSKE